MSAGNSWGTTGLGDTWAPAITTGGTYYSLNGSVARINATGTNAAWGQTLALARSGAVGVRSSNGGAAARPMVSFDDFRAQSVGMTVHASMRPHLLDFSGEPPGNEYIYWLGKGSPQAYEWAFRFYNRVTADRRNRISAYMWSPIPDGPNGLGTGGFHSRDGHRRSVDQRDRGVRSR